MVLESLSNPLKAQEHPWHLFFIGLLYNSIAIFLALWIFGSESSFVMVFLTVLASVPIVYNTIRLEEYKDMKLTTEKKILHEHNRAILSFSFLFLGIVVSAVVWYLFLPSESVANVFSQQVDTIKQINNNVAGSATGMAINAHFLYQIFFNNLKVLIFCILFAFIYGMGSIFILTWNATVIAAAIGNYIRSNLATISALMGFEQAAGYFTVVSAGFLRYAIHGVPEILAYFYGGIAGGIISIALMKKHFSSERSSALVLDISELLLISLGFLIVGALFEVYLTPLIF